MAILCATNFSEAARDASTAAALLARRANEPLVLLHLLPGGLSQALGTRLYEAARATLEQEQARLDKMGVRVTGRMAEGSLVKELPEAADEVKASLVVVGDPAEGGAAGGTVDRLARVIAVPLLIVKSTHAFGEWARAERSLRVVVGADRGAASDAALAFAAKLSTFGPVEVTVAHLWSPKVEQARTGIAAFGEDGTPLPAIEHAVRSRLETQVKAAGFEASPRIEVALEEGRDVSRPLLAMAQEARADLLVLGRKAVGRLAWPGSTVHRTLADAPFSLAVVPRTGPAHPAVEVPQGFRKLLVATDFSELGNSAVGRAVALLPTGGVVHLIHVADGAVTDQARTELLSLLEALIPSDAAWLGVHVLPHVLDPALTDVAILQAAERFGCELIVLGSHGRSGLRKVLLGGVAEGVVKGADRPVMVVRPKAD